jgi:ATP-dependent DNA helicase RecG
LIKSEPDTARHGRIREDVDGWDVATLLNKARLAKAGRLTRASILLLGKDESAHFISPVDAKMSWILRGEDGQTLDSQHHGCPFLLSTDRVFSRLRNLNVERMPDGTLFPEALQQYDSWVIREALHNAVAHQDYRLGGKINVSEFQDRIVISNLGQFIPPSVEWMLEHQSPPEHYRNQWLIEAMIRLRMMDQVGSGIRRMFTTQRERNFPMPDYVIDRSESHPPRVEVSIPGRIVDGRYTKLLIARDDIPLVDILLLDKVQKGVRLSKGDADRLRRARLVDGRYPNLYIGAKVAAATGQKAQHIRQRGFDNRYYLDMVRDLIREHGPVDRKEINRLLVEKLPEVLSTLQKASRVHNLLSLLSRQGEIHNHGSRRYPKWVIAGAEKSKS